MWPKLGNSSICMKEVIITTILYKDLIRNLGGEGGLKFYTRVTKVIKLNVRELCGLIPTSDVTGKKMTEELAPYPE